MNVLGTTGTRNIAQNDEPLYVERLTNPEMLFWLSNFDAFVSGACTGWDAVWGSTMRLTFPDKLHFVIVPANRSQIEPWWEAFDLGTVHLILMAKDTDYRARNEKIVEMSTHLYYCADYPEDHGKSRRSGTWMTVRIARKAGIPVHGFVINDVKENA